MGGLATRLETISGLRVFAHPPDNLTPPAAVVAFPDGIEYDTTMARGADRLSVPVHVLVGRVSDRSAANELGLYLSAPGAKSVKAAIEADKTLGGAAQTTCVTDANVEIFTVAGVDYLAATFTADVVA